jgi:hypothetical protein
MKIYIMLTVVKKIFLNLGLLVIHKKARLQHGTSLYIYSVYKSF